MRWHWRWYDPRPGWAHNAATTSRWLAIGQAAETGLLAALAARAGFTSDLALLDGPVSARHLSDRTDQGRPYGRARRPFALEEVSFKPWCAARQTMAATQAFIELIASGVAPGEITQLSAFVPPPHRPMVDHGVTGDRSSF